MLFLFLPLKHLGVLVSVLGSVLSSSPPARASYVVPPDPTDLSISMPCAVQYGSHGPHVATEHEKCDRPKLKHTVSVHTGWILQT